MSKAKTIIPPFAWLGRFWMPVGLGLVTLTAAFFRMLQLPTLPPGVDETSARIGLQSLKLASTHWVPSLDAANGYAPLWVWLQAISIQIFGHTPLALRVWPAILGTLAILAMWFWLNDWYGRRIAWVGALTMAVSPWAVTVSRIGIQTALFGLLVPLTLWLSSRAIKQPSAARYALLGGVLTADLLSGPLGWLLAATISAIGAWRLIKAHNLMNLANGRGVGITVAGLGAAVLAYFIGTSLPALASMPKALNLVSSPEAFGHNIVKVLLMFNVHGDENFRHNLTGEPLLNAFVGLMMVAGLLVAISRLHLLHYRVLLLLAVVMLAPATLTTTNVPNAAWAAGAMPLVFALVGIGTAYMLELWYATFPINSAARATGQAAIILLLTLTFLQGYTQYFRAWALSTAVYAAHNEGTTQIAQRLQATKYPSGERFAVVPSDQFPVIEYLAYGQKDYRIIAPAELASLPVAAGNRQFFIATSTRDETVKILKAKFPGGVVRPHISDFNLVENYYIYEVKK